MKKNFKALIIMILALIVCIPMQTIVKASTVTNMAAKKDVVVSKAFTVNFNKVLNASTVNTTNIKVLSNDNNYIAIKVSLASSKKSVLVEPVRNYEYNKKYTLIVKSQVKSSDGKFLPNEVRMGFTTVNATVGAKYKIVLDPGHGGYDPGAVGPTGVMEKTVNLAIALKAGAVLTKNGVETIYTRKSDIVSWTSNVTQNLQAICNISNNAKPNYFVSIHANSGVASASGTETYTYAGSASATKLAQAIQTEIVKATGSTNRGIRTENYYVLKHMDATSILIETGFISNIVQERLLNSSAYQTKVANAIAKGILNTLGITNIKY